MGLGHDDDDRGECTRRGREREIKEMERRFRDFGFEPQKGLARMLDWDLHSVP